MSLQNNPVVWFEIPAVDIARAKRFYEAAFGVELTLSEMGPAKMASFPMQQGSAGAAGALVCGEGYTPSLDGIRAYLHVADIDAVLAKVNENGGQTLLTKTSIGQHGSIAHFCDTEENRVSLHEAPRN